MPLSNFSKLLISIWIGTVAVIVEASADYLWVGTNQYWGKVTAINNDSVQFQVNCAGAPRTFKWKKGSFALTFTEGCKPVDFESWGEPVNCRKRGRVFVAGTPGGSGHFDFVNFENDVLVLGAAGQKSEVKTPRKQQTAIWLGCP
jgi:hypothetical protein